MNKILRLLSIIGCSVAVFIGMQHFSRSGGGALVAIAFALAGFAIWYIEYRQSLQGEAKIHAVGKKKAGFDWGMHYFRAFAILTIMATHYFSIYGQTTVKEVLFTGSTIYFLFISGYLCQYIDLRRRDSPLVYYRKKLTNVICPFLVFSILLSLAYNLVEFNFGFVYKIFLGRVQVQYWYIPFVSALFLVSPLICRAHNRLLIVITLVSLFFFLLFPFRPGVRFRISWPYTFYLYSYFTFFYVVGFLYCRFKETIDGYIKPYWYLFLTGAVSVLLILWRPEVFGLGCIARGFAIGMQRFLMIICAIIGLSYIKDKKIWVLDQLAKYSFTLYFIHVAVFKHSALAHNFLISRSCFSVLITDIIIFILFVAVMLVLSMALKMVIGKHSRLFIGT